VNCFERSAAERINADEKLINVAKDDRRFRSPAIWIRVMKFFVAKQHAALAKQFHNVRVSIENVLAGQVRQTGFIRKPAVIIDWR
jgi:hypothetical protein